MPSERQVAPGDPPDCNISQSNCNSIAWDCFGSRQVNRQASDIKLATSQLAMGFAAFRMRHNKTSLAVCRKRESSPQKHFAAAANSEAEHVAIIHRQFVMHNPACLALRIALFAKPATDGAEFVPPLKSIPPLT